MWGVSLALDKQLWQGQLFELRLSLYLDNTCKMDWWCVIVVLRSVLFSSYDHHVLNGERNVVTQFRNDFNVFSEIK